MLPIVATLAGAGLDLLASVIKQKGKEVAEKKLGVKIPDTPENLTPEKLIELRKLQYEHEEELKRLLLEERKTYIEDTQSARDTYKSVSTSPDTPFINKVFPSILAGVTVLLTFLMFFLFAINKFDGTQKDIVIYILGVLSTVTTQIFAFYFGSSMGSKEKTEILRRLK